jgi:hypothetical protein
MIMPDRCWISDPNWIDNALYLRTISLEFKKLGFPRPVCHPIRICRDRDANI